MTLYVVHILISITVKRITISLPNIILIVITKNLNNVNKIIKYYIILYYFICILL